MTTPEKVRLFRTSLKSLPRSSSTEPTDTTLGRCEWVASRSALSCSAATAMHLTPTAKSATNNLPIPDHKSNTTRRPG